MTAFVVSMLFLGCYVAYHVQVYSVHFNGPPAVAYVYYAILIPHVLLAACDGAGADNAKQVATANATHRARVGKLITSASPRVSARHP